MPTSEPSGTSDARTAFVAAGYDAMIDTWEIWKDQIRDDPRDEWCEELIARLPAGARVVELGCGGGTDETRRLAERFELTGVDLSVEQLRRARRRIPNAEFVHGDLTALDLGAGSFEGVASFYVFNHVPRELLADLFVRIHGWLTPGGLFLVTLGASDNPGWTGEWLGAPTFFSGFPPETNRVLLADTGFTLLRDELVTIQEPEGEGTFHWVLARQ